MVPGEGLGQDQRFYTPRKQGVERGGRQLPRRKTGQVRVSEHRWLAQHQLETEGTGCLVAEQQHRTARDVTRVLLFEKAERLLHPDLRVGRSRRPLGRSVRLGAENVEIARLFLARHGAVVRNAGKDQQDGSRASRPKRGINLSVDVRRYP